MAEYIEREDVLKIRYSSGYNCDGVLYVPFKDLTKGLSKIPAADVRENVKSMWVFEYTKDMMFGEQKDIYHCIECKFKTSGKYNFCPNCGADMREESE